jgi:metallo-beta-lactamase class B
MSTRSGYADLSMVPCDVQLGDHGAQYGMVEKFAKLKEGAPNPFIDPASCMQEADVEQAMFNAILAAAKP